jgi:hypothetical protein
MAARALLHALGWHWRGGEKAGTVQPAGCSTEGQAETAPVQWDKSVLGQGTSPCWLSTGGGCQTQGGGKKQGRFAGAWKKPAYKGTGPKLCGVGGELKVALSSRGTGSRGGSRGGRPRLRAVVSHQKVAGRQTPGQVCILKQASPL